MRCQMMRVISSPSISTTGFFTLIFAIADEPLRARMRDGGRRNAFGPRPYGAAGRILQGQNICVLNCARARGAPLCALAGGCRARTRRSRRYGGWVDENADMARDP